MQMYQSTRDSNFLFSSALETENEENYWGQLLEIHKRACIPTSSLHLQFQTRWQQLEHTLQNLACCSDSREEGNTKRGMEYLYF